ncbi:MAG TPA: cation-transporting P-type ATPase [Sandaracinaceae bacterium LLY-WYZ-13_1]|nr:cation-transporting P-type ATPase [Sandaracinaceae bacterium LLY-WYZ-13_1]
MSDADRDRDEHERGPRGPAPRHGEVEFHTLGPDAAVRYWDADPENGLSGAEVARRRERLGENALPEPPKPSALKQLLGQFTDPLVGALLVAALVSLGVAMTEGEGSWLSRFSDTIAILLIVVVNALLGFFQERRAEAALDALQKMAAPNATVIRDGAAAVLPARALVPGDVVELAAGDSVPADVRLLDARDFSTEEAALTGESTPVQKRAEPVLQLDAPLADRENMVFMGTTATRGRARGLVVQTGRYTELGRIGSLIRSAEREDTPLEQRLSRLGTIILAICLALSVLLFVLGIAQQNRAWTVLLLTAVSLAVAAIPEGLPAITTITLALGMQRMAQRGAIIRKLPAVETLGSATVICSDKTGTLTQNAMTVRAVATASADYVVSGEGYAPDGELRDADGAPVGDPPEAVRRLAEVSALCNTAAFEQTDEGRRVLGDPTEGALLVLAGKLGVGRDALYDELEIERELPFDSDRKRMSVVVKHPDGERMAYVKGSPDQLLPLCDRVMTDEGIEPLDDARREALAARNEAYAADALRVLGLAIRPDPDPEDPEAELVFVGFAAMIDSPRPEVREAVEECKAAGIRVVMITGDHKLTAVAIAKELGIWHDDAIAMTGAEIEETNEQRLLNEIDRVAVFARTTAEQKLRLVRTLKQRGHVAAMTGDGVNDAPALREAQIGVAMGLGGTDVAREAAEMVLADDNFATIVEAVREGRAIFRNIQKFIFFLNSSNAGLVVAVIVGSFFADWMPQLTPLQLLWVNLVTNGLPALALGVDPPDPGQMAEPPRSPEEGIVGWRDFAGMLLVGSVMGGAALSLYWLPEVAPHLVEGDDRAQMLERCRAMAFTLLAVSPLFHAFNCRSTRRSALSRIFSNPALWGAIAVSLSVHVITLVVPALHPVFHTYLLSPTEVGVVLALAVLPVPVFETIKLVSALVRRARA